MLKVDLISPCLEYGFAGLGARMEKRETLWTTRSYEDSVFLVKENLSTLGRRLFLFSLGNPSVAYQAVADLDTFSVLVVEQNFGFVVGCVLADDVDTTRLLLGNFGSRRWR